MAADDAPDEARHRRPELPLMDMSGFEAALIAASEDGVAASAAGGVLFQGCGPGVEWAIAWADGRVSPVDCGAASRAVVARSSGVGGRLPDRRRLEACVIPQLESRSAGTPAIASQRGWVG